MAQLMFNHVNNKPPFFDGISSFDHWKRKMKTHLGNIREKVWDVTENDYAILDPHHLTNDDRINKQCNTCALNTLYQGLDSKVFEQIKDLDKAHDVWNRLETYEGTSTVKSAKLYILKDKFASFKMKDDESIPKMFYKFQVIINDLKGLGEDIKDKDFSHKFLLNLPKKFTVLKKMI
jgi:hypothetical protein